MTSDHAPKPYYQDAWVTIYHGEALELLPSISGADLVVTDPPYAFGLASSGLGLETKAGRWGDLMNNATFYASILRECHRLTVNRSGAAWVFNSWRSLPTLMRASCDAPWAINSLLVWDKEWIGPGGPQGLRPSYELVALFVQPGFAIADRGLPDIWRSKWSSLKPSGHPAEKPIDLVTRILVESGGQLVVDPFLGSGTTAVAAKSLGRRAIGIEIEERFCEMAAERCRQDVLPLAAAL